MAEFGARVRALRKQRGVDQEVIARALGYAVSAKNSPISKLKRGKLNLTLAKAFKLAEVLGVAPAELFMTPAELEAAAQSAAAGPPGSPSDEVLTEADCQLVQRLADFLADAGPELRRRMTEQIETMQALKEKLTHQGGSGGAEGGDTLAS
jgi:transcriptional regulator with XRE-family HTH domain